jgi:acetyl-CoA synthetase
VLDESSGEDAGTEQGLLVLRRPWPGMLRTLYRARTASSRPTGTKFGLDTYAVGEAARRDEDGYFWVMGRVDDVFKRRGPPHVHSEIRVGDRVAREGRRGGRDRADRLRDLGSYQGNGDDQLISDIREHVAKRIGKLARPKRIIWADDQPKTRSGKIMRWLLREHRGGASSATSRRCATPTSCSTSRRRSPSARAGTRNGGGPVTLAI